MVSLSLAAVFIPHGILRLELFCIAIHFTQGNMKLQTWLVGLMLVYPTSYNSRTIRRNDEDLLPVRVEVSLEPSQGYRCSDSD
ncbi:hypothetical protein EV361DRAFT_942756 [Lentinula raphanica]|nr:hypothetical protein EV361DRAFT_942756 [Lentinula raphanica]